MSHKSTGALSRQYFLYFAVLGVFLPYFNLYCYHIGMNGLQIGTISAVRSVVMVAFTLLWAALADRLMIRKGVFVFCNILSAVIWVFMLSAEGYGSILWISVIHAIFLGPMIAFLEAFTMETLEEDRGMYGRIRVWGSLGFIIMVVVMGRVAELYSLWLIVPVILAGFIAQAVNSFKISGVSSRGGGLPSRGIKDIITARSSVFLAVGFLMLVSHGAYYGFFSIHLEKEGFGNLFMGVSWAVAIAAEITVMIFAQVFLKRFVMERVLLFSLIAAVVRWGVLGLTSNAIIILLSQCLHAFTYATFHVTSILFMDQLSSREFKTIGQSLNNSVQYGIGMMVGFFLAGYLYEVAGTAFAFIVSAGISGAAFIIMWTCQAKPSGSLQEPREPLG